MAAFAFMAGIIFPSYGLNPDQKSFSERNNVQESNGNSAASKQDLKDAQGNSDDELRKFKEESAIKIRENKRMIADLKVRVSRFHAREKADFHRNLGALEQRNKKLKKEVAHFKASEQDNLLLYERDINHDLNEVGDALKDFTINNKL